MNTIFIISTSIAIASGLFLIAMGISGMVRSGIRKDMQELLKKQ